MSAPSIAGLLEHAEARCVARMEALAESCEGEIPKAWFTYHEVEKQLRRLKHTAAQAERTDDGPTE